MKYPHSLYLCRYIILKLLQYLLVNHVMVYDVKTDTTAFNYLWCLFKFTVSAKLLLARIQYKGQPQSELLVILSALNSAATGQVGIYCFSQINTLLIHAAQNHRTAQVSVCKNGRSKAVRYMMMTYSLHSVVWRLADSPAGTQWKPTLTAVVLSGTQPGRQRSTGSTE